MNGTLLSILLFLIIESLITILLFFVFDSIIDAISIEEVDIFSKEALFIYLFIYLFIIIIIIINYNKCN